MAWTAEQQREHRRANPARYAKYDRDKYLKDPEKARQKVRKAIRKMRGCPEPTRPEPAQCEICGNVEHLIRKGILCHLAVDHDHATGKFRGWICNRCNLGLGKIGDTIEAVERLLAYLKRAQEQWSLSPPNPSMTSSPKSGS